MVVFGAVGVLVTPAVDAIPNGAAAPRFTGERPMPRTPALPLLSKPRIASPHPDGKALSSNAMDHTSGLIGFSNLFICFPFI
jgi:hypothetical protein